MMLNTALPCLIASGCFYLCGKPYVEFKQKQNEEVTDAIETATQMNIEMANKSLIGVIKARLS